MHQNKSGIYANNLSVHASLLLSASPTIISSPLQNTNTNNPQTSPITPSVGIVRRQPSTPLLSASNLDNDSLINTDSPTNSNLTECHINFNKPQNEMFKKLDGKIQKIVAAHSNLNKLYALNDFSSLGAGPKRPFELPPQLPPPPPWIPKIWERNSPTPSTNQWNEEGMNPLNVLNEPSNLDMTDFSPTSSLFSSNSGTREPSNNLLTTKPSLTIDSAISKLHQRRQQQQQQQQLQRKPRLQQLIASQHVDRASSGPIPCSSSSTSSPSQPSFATITPANLNLIAQKIKDCLVVPDRSGNFKNKMNPEPKKFREDLIRHLTTEIFSVANRSKLQVLDRIEKIQAEYDVNQKSLLSKSSPQTLYNTIRRETSLLLNKRGGQVNRSGLSLLSDQQTFNRNQNETISAACARDRSNRIQTIKVVVPPIEYLQSPPQSQAKNCLENVTTECSDDPRSHSTKRNNLTYQVIKNKIRLFEEKNHIYLGKSRKLAPDLGDIGFKRRKSNQNSLDKIVDRLQAKWSPSPTEPNTSPVSSGNQKATNLHQRIINSSASLLQCSRNVPTLSTPTQIPVFRSPLSMTSKGGYFYATSGPSKIVNSKSKKSKRFHYFGLRIANYLEKECPQPTTEKITIEQFAKCLDLVRSNDVSLQRHQEQLSQSESKWRMPVGNRPLRLRRIRGERIHMPASASYKATRKVGLQ